MIAISALAGLTDVDAITLSMANYAQQGGDARVAVTSIVVASLSNTLVKCGIAAFLGGKELRRYILLGTVGIVAAGVFLLLW